MAATRSGVGYAEWNGTPPARIEEGDSGGRVHSAYDIYTLDANSLGLNDVINMMVIPQGARIVGAKLINSAGLGGSGAVSLGWTDNGTDGASSAGIFSALDVHTAAALAGTTSVVLTAFGKKFSKPTQIQVLCSTACTATSGTIQVFVDYVLP